MLKQDIFAHRTGGREGGRERAIVCEGVSEGEGCDTSTAFDGACVSVDVPVCVRINIWGLRVNS